MFDLIAGATLHAPRPRAVPVLVSLAAHAAVAGTVVIGTALFVGERLPETAPMAAFVAAQPSFESPALPPAQSPRRTRPIERKAVESSADGAPIDAPAEIPSGGPIEDFDEADLGGGEDGVPGGLFRGAEVEILPPPPPPPPPPPAPSRPIRVGGEVQEPTLVYRVEPIYPTVAVVAGLEGTVILEAIVDAEGSVESLKVLRSGGVLDRSALEAVRRWKYSPVLLNGRPVRFMLTVVVSFRLTDAKQ